MNKIYQLPRPELEQEVILLQKRVDELEQTAGPADTSDDRPEGVPPEWGQEGRTWFRKTTIGEAYRHPHLSDPETRQRMDQAMQRGHVLDDLDDAEPKAPTAQDMSGPEGLYGQAPEPGCWYRSSTLKRITCDGEQLELHSAALHDAVSSGRILDDVGQ